ncbi:hypothetical protein MYAM1_001616 [Malassezia yamatoensis]|uniref:PWI domain-containing protein n=1 Tax=Malassezia yamatoensis TaxID=253288 RepID=A0AAJ5YQR6_9BASI|nr:hypothetical protein MYAM1_001616 [Malassezia yamatoensis]
MVDGFRGVNVSEDVRFKDKENALLKTTKYPANFERKVDMRKVNMQVMRPWIAEKIESLLGFEDEVLVELVSDQLENEAFPDPRKMQISLTGFLEKRTRSFMAELWSLLLSAQESVAGIPRLFVEQKKAEMQQKRAESDHVRSEVRRREAIPSSRHSDIPRNPGRFDRGLTPIHADQRNSRPGSNTDSFVDKNGNFTRRERDSGWSSRRPRREASPDLIEQQRTRRQDFYRSEPDSARTPPYHR